MHCLILHITPEYRCVTKTMGRKGLLAKIQEGTSRLDFKQINRTVHNPVLQESIFVFVFRNTQKLDISKCCLTETTEAIHFPWRHCLTGNYFVTYLIFREEEHYSH